MDKFSKGNKNGEKGSAMPKTDGALKQVSNGSMDYMEKQESFEKKDAAKISRGSFKDRRY